MKALAAEIDEEDGKTQGELCVEPSRDILVEQNMILRKQL